MTQATEKKKTRLTRQSGVSERAAKYATDVTTGKIIASPLVRAACRRHLDDLKNGHKRGLIFDKEAAGQAYRFFENVLKLNGGKHEGKPFILSPWQSFIVGSLFGWKRDDGRRRFQTAFIEIGKGNGKSPLAAGIGLYGMVADGEPRAEIYAGAPKKEQAQILFRDAVAMVDQSPLLSARLTKSGKNPVWQLSHIKSGSWFKPISADDRQSGHRPHIALVDEIHEHKDATVIDMLTAGFKGRTNPMIVEITNSGVDRQSVCFQHHEYSERVVTGLADNDEWFAFVCGMDEDDDPLNDESVWVKANPNLGKSIDRDYIRKQIKEATGMPSKLSIVKRLNFCQWVDAANPWIDGDLWRACEVMPSSWEPPEGVEPVGALDLSGTKDLTALALAWRMSDGKCRAKVFFFTPKDALTERSKTDKVPYDVWVKDGHLIATPGRAVDYSFVAQKIKDLQEEFGLRRIAFDAYKIKYLEKELDAIDVEVELVPHGQGFYKSKESGLWMPHSIDLTDDLLSKHRLSVCKNPALTFASASAVTEEDAQENRRFTKRNSKARIDGVVALVMAIGLAYDGEVEDIEPEIILL